MSYSQAEARKEINKIAKENGLVFKKQDSKINGSQAYMFTNRATGLPVIKDCTFWNAYENCMSGYVESKRQK